MGREVVKRLLIKGKNSMRQMLVAKKSCPNNSKYLKRKIVEDQMKSKIKKDFIKRFSIFVFINNLMMNNKIHFLP